MPTESEGILTELAIKHLLKPWCFAHPHRDQGSQRGKVVGKELCDLLIVFGRNIVIISDKHVAFGVGKKAVQGGVEELESTNPDKPGSVQHLSNTGANRDLSWSRWYRHAVIDSAKQLEGAKRWILGHPQRVFKDGGCQEQIELPSQLDAADIFLIVTCRGAKTACQSFFGGGSGSLMLQDGQLDDPTMLPFHVGTITHKGTPVAVFDSEVLDIVFKHLDTLPDFLRYLKQRQMLTLSGQSIYSAGEEELLSVYLSRLNQDGQHGFGNLGHLQGIGIDEGMFHEYTASSAYASKREADRVSYIWDRLITQLNDRMCSIDGQPLPYSNQKALYFLASVNRVKRRMMAKSVLQVIEAADGVGRYTRVVAPIDDFDPLWVLMALDRPEYVDFDRYLEVRQDMLWKYVLAARHVHGSQTDVVGLGFNARSNIYTSEDLLILEVADWTPDLAEEGRIAHEEEGYLQRANFYRSKESEYPNVSLSSTGKGRERSRSNRVGRNMQCPCGSGRKYKSCCWQSGRFR